MNPATFEFKELLLSDRILDRLEFSEYWDENCTWGGRTITLGTGDNECNIRIWDQEEMDDDCEGFYGGGSHVPHKFSYNGYFNRGDPAHNSDLYFLHQLYDVIEFLHPQHIDEFVERCDKNNMGNQIKSYLEFKLTHA